MLPFPTRKTGLLHPFLRGKWDRSIFAIATILLLGILASANTAAQSINECDENGTIVNSCSYSEIEIGSSVVPQHSSIRDWLNGEETCYRKSWADNGVELQNNVTSYFFGNTHGGREQEFLFSGHGDYLAKFDINKMGGPQGQFLQIRAEHRFGESITNASGAFLPPTVATSIPIADSEQLYLTNVLFTQAFSESFAVYAGKMDTLGSNSPFAGGRGIHQFSNLAFVGNPIGLRTVAYSSLGTGFVILKDRQPIFNFLVFNAKDTTATDGFSELFADGVVLAPELTLPTNFLGLRGSHSFGGIWNSRKFASLSQSPLVFFPSVPIARQSGSWALTYEFDQYLFADPCDSKRGWGVFGRYGIADPETNPIRYFASVGVGGNSPLSGRTYDRFGMGWFYFGKSNEIAPFAASILGGLRDGQGGEVFYNAAINRRVSLTADGQLLQSALSSIDTALIVGLRANISF